MTKAQKGTAERVPTTAAAHPPKTSSRLDSKALKAALPEVAERFMKQTAARRFLLV